ncbi:hypothetical protein [Nannocystis pusilla]|uniref:hypothetical protein n=1 Tax=Nannocystis pusilla TaxID=889268 RepID=UPI003B7EA226
MWDIYQNVEVEDDQIGRVAIVDGNGALQIMFGIGGLTYDYATVCVQGRSYSVGSSVTFTVQNQLNKCGNTGSMANDWSIHSTGVDLETCIVDNNEFQGLRIFASGGSGASRSSACASPSTARSTSRPKPRRVGSVTRGREDRPAREMSPGTPGQRPQPWRSGRRRTQRASGEEAPSRSSRG